MTKLRDVFSYYAIYFHSHGWELRFYPLVQMCKKHVILALPHPLNYLFLNHYHIIFPCLVYIFNLGFLTLKGLFSKIRSLYN